MPGKFASPPPHPGEVAQRVWRLSSLDGRTILIIASVAACIAASVRDAPATIAGVLAAGAGALELHGANLIRAGEARGLRWLVVSQLSLLVIVLGYIAARITLFDPATVDALITPELELQFANAGISRAELPGYVRSIIRFGYGVLAFGTLCYQGGMAWYFHRNRHAVRAALGGNRGQSADAAD